MIIFNSKRLDSDLIRDKVAGMKGQSITRIHIEVPKGKVAETSSIIKDVSKLANVTTEESDRKMYKTSIYHTGLSTKGRH